MAAILFGPNVPARLLFLINEVLWVLLSLACHDVIMELLKLSGGIAWVPPKWLHRSYCNQIAKTLIFMSIKYRSDIFASDRCLIEINSMVSAIWEAIHKGKFQCIFSTRIIFVLYFCKCCIICNTIPSYIRPDLDRNRLIHVLVQDCSISSALAMELLQSCTEPSWLWDECFVSHEFALFALKLCYFGMLIIIN